MSINIILIKNKIACLHSPSPQYAGFKLMYRLRPDFFFIKTFHGQKQNPRAIKKKSNALRHCCRDVGPIDELKLGLLLRIAYYQFYYYYDDYDDDDD